MKKGITVIAALIAVLAVTSGAFAANHYLITSSSQIKSGAIALSDLSSDARTALKGKPGLTGAFYATAFYNAGDTNEGAIATVACDATKTDYVAISGGVQVLGLDEGANSRNTPVSSSFPGRMDWARMPRSRVASTAGSSSSAATPERPRTRLPRRSRSGRSACPVPASR